MTPTLAARFYLFLFVGMFCCLLCWHPKCCLAENVAPPVPESPEQANEGTEDEHQWLDDTQEGTSQTLYDTAHWIDSFFDDSRFSEEENRSRAKLRLSTRISEDDSIDFHARLGLRVHLPKISKKVQLMLFTVDDDDLNADRNRDDVYPTSRNEEDNVGAALRYAPKEDEDKHLSFTFGGSTNYVYTGGRYRYLHQFDQWQGRFVEQLRYYTDDGWENEISVDMERTLAPGWLSRNTVELHWHQEDEENLPHSFTTKLYQELSKDAVLSYEGNVSFDTDPSYVLSNVHAALRYRQRYLRDWLFFEVIPEVDFPYEEDREPELAVIFKLEANFGYHNVPKSAMP